MSFQWTFIAGYLYFEVAVVIIMILPIFSPRRWNQFFKSRLFYMFQEHAAVYFYVLLGVLSLFLLDAIREMRKYSHSTEGSGHTHLTSEMKGNVKLFRAQRNFYITGFAIFLAFVIRRLVNMLIAQDELRKQAEEAKKEVEVSVQKAKAAILADTLQATESQHAELKEKIETTESLLEVEKERVRQLEEQVKMWKSRYEELSSTTVSVGKGDE